MMERRDTARGGAETGERERELPLASLTQVSLRVLVGLFMR